MQLSKNTADFHWPSFLDPAGFFRQNRANFKSEISILIFYLQVVGVTGLEPVTPRLSSACSNQLSYTPRALAREFQISNCKFEIQIGGAEETRTPDL